MKLADKPVYPVGIMEDMKGYDGKNSFNLPGRVDYPGITFREALILSLAGNVGICDLHKHISHKDNLINNAATIVNQADAIIKILEE